MKKYVFLLILKTISYNCLAENDTTKIQNIIDSIPILSMPELYEFHLDRDLSDTILYKCNNKEAIIVFEKNLEIFEILEQNKSLKNSIKGFGELRFHLIFNFEMTTSLGAKRNSCWQLNLDYSDMSKKWRIWYELNKENICWCEEYNVLYNKNINYHKMFNHKYDL